MTLIGTLVAKLVMDAGEFDKAVNDAEKKSSAFGKNLQTVGKIAGGAALIGVAALAGGIALIGSKAIPAASNLNEAVNAVNVVFGESAGKILEWGKTADTQAGLSQSAFAQMAAQTGAMLQNFGLDTDDAATQTINLAQRASDMASIFNTDVNDALMAIQAGLRGEANPLERFGVGLNEAAVNAKALEMGLANAEGEIDATAKTQARLALIFEQTDKIAGDFVNTSDQLANASRVNQARWENFMASVGKVGLPIMTTFQGLFASIGEKVFPMVEEALTNILPVVEAISGGFTTFVEAILNGTPPLEALSPLIETVGQALGMSKTEAADLAARVMELVAGFQEFLARVQEFVAPITEWIAQFVSWKDVLIALGLAILAVLVPAIISLVASMLPIILTIGAVIAVVAFLRNAWEKDWGGIRTKLTEFWETTGRPIFELLKTWLQENIPKAIAILKQFWETVLLPAIQMVWAFIQNSVFPLLKTLWDWLATNVPQAIQVLTDYWNTVLLPAIKAVWGFINTNLVPLFKALWDLLQVAGKKAIEIAKAAWENTLKPALEVVWKFIKENVIPIISDLLDWIEDKLAPPLNWLAKTVLAGVKSAFNDIVGAIQTVISWIKTLTDKLASVKVPKLFQPGSPTPFELGIRGISDAMDELSRKQIPAMNMAMATAGNGGGNTYQYYLQGNYRYETEQSIVDRLRVMELLRK